MRRTFVVSLVLFVLALVPATAGANIVLNRSIAGVRLGARAEQVRLASGETPRQSSRRNQRGSYSVFTFPKARLVVEFQGGTDQSSVSSVETRNPAERTSSGLHVGSTATQVKARLHGERCAGIVCYVGRLEAGRASTTFVFHNHRVSRISVDILLD